jgi:hypothetical protein
MGSGGQGAVERLCWVCCELAGACGVHAGAPLLNHVHASRLAQLAVAS